jgi:hypothetical protein
MKMRACLLDTNIVSRIIKGDKLDILTKLVHLPVATETAAKCGESELAIGSHLCRKAFANVPQ